jgi:hypothetical protein
MAARFPVKSKVILFKNMANGDKACHLKAGKGAGIWRVMEPHYCHSLFNVLFLSIVLIEKHLPTVLS